MGRQTECELSGYQTNQHTLKVSYFHLFLMYDTLYRLQEDTYFVRNQWSVHLLHGICTFYLSPYLLGIDRIGLSQQKEILRVERHKQGAIHVEVPKLGGKAFEPTTPDEHHNLQ